MKADKKEIEFFAFHTRKYPCFMLFALIFIFLLLFGYSSHFGSSDPKIASRKENIIPPLVLELEPPMPPTKLCNINLKDGRAHFSKENLTKIYFVTPTYPRPTQVADLTRLSHTLMHVPCLHWIVADDEVVCSAEVLRVLKKSHLPFTHISSPKPSSFRVKGNIPRGVVNRRAAISWIYKNVQSGVIYFGDDDNTVDLELFIEMRKTQKISMFPVGLIGTYGVSSPIVRDGKVVGFFDSWPARRKFPVDMAGFAINRKLLSPNTFMPYWSGHEEDIFLKSLGVDIADIQPLADNCSKILVWHTRTINSKKTTLKIDFNYLSKPYKSFQKLLQKLSDLNIATLDSHVGEKLHFTRNQNIYNNIEHLTENLIN